MPADLTDIEHAKQAARERMWALLDREGAVSPAGTAGHIPSFVGAEEAARRLSELAVWQHARIIKANPDRAQLPVRVMALHEQKLVYMAVPAMAREKPFFRLDPLELGENAMDAASSKKAAILAPTVGVDEMQPIDLVMCGSVAVGGAGTRLGKGAGYSDIEVALLIEAGLVTDETQIVTTVHDLQVVEEPLPEDVHDFRVDLIVTPSEVIQCPRTKRPQGLVWENLSEEKIRSVPALGVHQKRMGRG
jgi:5-formyltetrahydrofolate cyclo-ligase